MPFVTMRTAPQRWTLRINDNVHTTGGRRMCRPLPRAAERIREHDLSERICLRQRRILGRTVTRLYAHTARVRCAVARHGATDIRSAPTRRNAVRL